jgi:Helix-turn-helix domain
MSESPQAESVNMYGIELVPEIEVARVLRKTKAALVEMRARRLGPCFHKIGGSVYYSPDDVRKWLESMRVVTKRF